MTPPPFAKLFRKIDFFLLMASLSKSSFCLKFLFFSVKGAKKRMVEDNQFCGFNIRSGCGLCPGLMQRCFRSRAADEQGKDTYDTVYYHTGEDRATYISQA